MAGTREPSLGGSGVHGKGELLSVVAERILSQGLDGHQAAQLRALPRDVARPLNRDQPDGAGPMQRRPAH